MTRFKMPMLSNYWFYPDGTVMKRQTSEMIKDYPRAKTGKCRLVTDYESIEIVTRKEIIQYGKHLKALEIMTTGYGALKYRDLIYEFNNMIKNNC